jgi:hypothetical protein
VQLREATLVCSFQITLFIELTGRLLASGTVKKVIEINPYLLGTMAGGAGACIPPIVKKCTLTLLQLIANIGRLTSECNADCTNCETRNASRLLLLANTFAILCTAIKEWV